MNIMKYILLCLLLCYSSCDHKDGHKFYSDFYVRVYFKMEDIHFGDKRFDPVWGRSIDWYNIIPYEYRDEYFIIFLESDSNCSDYRDKKTGEVCHKNLAKKFGDRKYKRSANHSFAGNSASPWVRFGAISDTVKTFDIITKDAFGDFDAGESISEIIGMRYYLAKPKSEKKEDITTTLKEFNQKGGEILMSSQVGIWFIRNKPNKEAKHKFEIRITTDRKTVVKEWEPEFKNL